MKALAILKHLTTFCGAELHNDCIDAIAELEALQQRSCESCVHRSFIDETLTNKVTNGFCVENGFFTKVGFCCNRHIPKEKL